ncbi:MAG: hypothetical protein KME09_06925 [Pleurocapsa minor HA4230-MV1]|jgi:hypothetical protein|nr:hypothetical protein [Pleurocapsa minor HA4230-MV1]
MTWNEIGQWVIDQPETVILSTFSSRIAVKVSEPSRFKSTWNLAGFFYSYLDIPLVGLVKTDEKFNVSLKEPTLFVPQVFKPSYTLKFFKVAWISSLTLTIYEDSMPINFEPAAPVVNVPSLFASAALGGTVPISTTSVAFLAANANRKKLVIANNSNQDLYIDLDATASVADHAIKIPKVSASGFIASYELENYTGVVSGIWAAAGSGAALIREMVA